MKKGIFTLFMLSAIWLTSCRKDAIAPKTAQSASGQPTVAITTSLNQITVTAGIDSTKGYLRIQMAKDTFNTCNILIQFNPDAKTTYGKNEDAPYFSGFGLVSLASLSSDNVALAINDMPLSTVCSAVALKVGAKSDGVYKLNMVTISSVPATYDIWLKDNYKKDSLDFRHYPSYLFNVLTKDTASFGSHRFSIILRKK